MTENEISYVVRGCVFEVYNQLGPGLLESVYESAMYLELKNNGLRVRREVPLPVYYIGIKLDVGFRLDLLVEEKVIIELKSLEIILNVHHKQLLTYLKIAEKKLGILVNFNVENITDGIYRKVNGL